MTIAAQPQPAVPSPCTSVCTIDQATGLCAGCARTLDEIALWSRYSDDEKRAVLAKLPKRRTKPVPGVEHGRG
jgi:uncharacterized protein